MIEKIALVLGRIGRRPRSSNLPLVDAHGGQEPMAVGKARLLSLTFGDRTVRDICFGPIYFRMESSHNSVARRPACPRAPRWRRFALPVAAFLLLLLDYGASSLIEGASQSTPASDASARVPPKSPQRNAHWHANGSKPPA